jgi:hypothetical protein
MPAAPPGESGVELPFWTALRVVLAGCEDACWANAAFMLPTKTAPETSKATIFRIMTEPPFQSTLQV